MDSKERFRYFLVKYFAKSDARSIREVARTAGISHVHLMDIKSGKKEPTLHIAEQIAHAIGKELWEVLSPGRVAA